ncbi:phosphate ABC transporter substrate-binding protein [Anaerobium acetethylicum]|uniref:Phosphate-binding protein n=1 Tax=Anaerobium acetethylicum TaxID=1619234 RepID=A0A1D3TRS1_9FIRM|nr:phosphate ABC transporter substrate-binding protein [Anaerobium acetethylicum]SCP96477.1 phosphate transport system substrate-binding protein [Anaerobium acetethylicum]
MKVKSIIAAAVACVLAMGISGCGNENSAEDDDRLKGTIVITGSTSVEDILTDMMDEFEALYPSVSIEYTGSGSSAGIKDTKAGVNNIGASSREIKEEEKDEKLKEEVFAYDGIAAIVNPANEIQDITLQQLADIYSGKITNWSEIGGKDETIFVVSREESSGTRSAFEELTGLPDAGGLTSKAAVAEGNGPVQASVAGNKNAIGYVSFAYIDESVKALKLDGAEPTPEASKTGEYKLSRPFVFVYYEDKATEAGLAFLEFAVSEDGQYCVEDNHGITVD